jgi:hypothetical protein
LQRRESLHSAPELEAFAKAVSALDERLIREAGWLLSFSHEEVALVVQTLDQSIRNQRALLILVIVSMIGMMAPGGRYVR